MYFFLLGTCQCTLGMDTHFLTYDKQRIDFTGACTYLVTASTIPDDKCKFRIMGKYADKGTRIPLSTLEALHIEFNGDRIKLNRNSECGNVYEVRETNCIYPLMSMTISACSSSIKVKSQINESAK